MQLTKSTHNKLSCSKSPKAQQVESFTRARKPSDFLVTTYGDGTFASAQTAHLGSFAKVSIPVKYIIP